MDKPIVITFIFIVTCLSGGRMTTTKENMTTSNFDEYDSFVMVVSSGGKNCTGVVISKRWLLADSCPAQNGRQRGLTLFGSGAGSQPAEEMIAVTLDEGNTTLVLIQGSFFGKEPVAINGRLPLMDGAEECLLCYPLRNGSIAKSPINILDSLPCNSLYGEIWSPNQQICGLYKTPVRPSTGSPIFCDKMLTGTLARYSLKRSEDGRNIGIFLRTAAYSKVLQQFVTDLPAIEQGESFEPIVSISTAGQHTASFLCCFVLLYYFDY